MQVRSRFMLMHAIVRGRVQGVGFRYFVRKAAGELGVRGWVRNCPDGTVEVEAEGSEGQLDEFEVRLNQGPALARVSSVDATRSREERNYTDFEVTG